MIDLLPLRIMLQCKVNRLLDRNESAADIVALEQLAVLASLLCDDRAEQQIGRVGILPIVYKDGALRNQPDQRAAAIVGIVEPTIAGAHGSHRPCRKWWARDCLRPDTL